jgi:hypothetical protein
MLIGVICLFQIDDLEKRQEEKAKLAAEKAAEGTTTIGFGTTSAKEESGTTTIGFDVPSSGTSTTVFGFGATASKSSTASISSKENTNNVGFSHQSQPCAANVMQVLYYC